MARAKARGRTGAASSPLPALWTSLATRPALATAAAALPITATNPQVTPPAPARCDCLNWCGDDPWLHDGRSKPCDAALAREAKRAARAAQIASVSRLARDLVAMADECGTAVISAEDMRAIAALLPAT